MRPWLKHLLLLAALSLATWAAVIAAWYAQRRVVSLDDVLQYLLALPLLLFAGVLVLRGMRRGARSAPSTKPAPNAPTAAFEAATPAADTGTPCPVLGAWVHTVAGADLPSLLAALAEGRPRPGPDAQLRDLDGLPVLSARIAALDLAAVQAVLPPYTDLPPATLRVLAALSPLLDQAMDALAAMEEAADEATDAAGAHAAPGPAPDLHVLACWPATWSTAEAQAAQAWLAQRLQPLAGTSALATATATGAELLLQAQAYLHQRHRAGHAGRVLALACHSDLDDAAVQRLEHLGRLYAMPRCPHGVIPGEAAAALLLATPGGGPSPADAAAAPALLALHAQPHAPTAASDRRGAASAAQAASLETQLDAALGTCGLEAAAIACLCADADQHGPAAAPLYALAQSALPHLDALEDVRLTGMCCGHTGAVAPLLALAVAWGQCAQDERPAAAVSLTENGWRLASVLGPYTPMTAPTMTAPLASNRSA